MLKMNYKKFWDEEELCDFVNDNNLILNDRVEGITFRNSTGYVIFYDEEV